MRNEEYTWELKEIFPSELRVDERYQRSIKDSQVKRAIGEFNINIINPPKVNRRDDGHYYIMDGDHTVTIWKQKYGNKPIKCRVYNGLTWKEEAEIFLAQNGVASAVTKKEKLNTRYNMGDTDVCQMVDAAKQCGVGVAFYKASNANGKCNATDAMFEVYKRVGEKTFQDILDVIMQAWGGEKESLYSGFLKGLCKFYELYNGRFTKRALIESLRANSPQYYIREAKNRASGNLAVRYCWTFLKAYNKKRSSNRLPDVL